MTAHSADRDSADTDFGAPATFVEDFDNEAQLRVRPKAGAVWDVGPSAGSGTRRVRLLVCSGSSAIEDIWILDRDDETDEWIDALHVHGETAARLVALMRNNAFDPLDGSPMTSRAVVLPDAVALSASYEDDPAALRALIEGDAKASDVIAFAHRKAVVEKFRRLIEDEAFFDAERDRLKKSEEGVWQDFLEANPWLLGLGLSSQLFVGWDSERLEQVVAGSDVGKPGKRADALLRTAGVVRLLAFVEIKHHRTRLLGKKDYRSGCFAPSRELSGAVAQSQGTVQLAQEALGTLLKETDDDGFDLPGADAYIYRPRSFVVAGRLNEFVSSSGGHHAAKIRSFELFRRSLQAPDVITFDELLARAEALVQTHERLVES